jgi:hypothetical protein
MDVLKSEIELSVGCIDPGAVCLAVHKATRALGPKPSQVTVAVSPNIYKNGISVGVPGTREWVIRASQTGEQKFKATLIRSFEAVTGNESSLVLTVNVVG